MREREEKKRKQALSPPSSSSGREREREVGGRCTCHRGGDEPFPDPIPAFSLSPSFPHILYFVCLSQSRRWKRRRFKVSFLCELNTTEIFLGWGQESDKQLWHTNHNSLQIYRFHIGAVSNRCTYLTVKIWQELIRAKKSQVNYTKKNISLLGQRKNIFETVQ